VRRAALVSVFALAMVLFGASPAAAQSGRCLLVLENVDRQGVKEETPAGTNYYAGGNVRLRCRDTAVRMSSDSVAVFGGNVARFIGAVRYADSTLEVTADTGTYYKDGERWEARGRVTTRNLSTGSALQGPSLDYLRAATGLRDTSELWAVRRPTIRYTGRDSAGAAGEPYLIVADRVRLRGDEQVWAGGTVTVDRSDFAARGDSLWLDTGPRGLGLLLGDPVMKGLGTDTFTLTGQRIDLRLEGREVTYVTATTKAHAVTPDWDLTADSIALDVADDEVEQTLAWGGAVQATGEEYAVRGDSLAIDTPGQRLRGLRAFGDAWMGGEVDSASKERDWLAGDTVAAVFAARDSADTGSTVLQRMSARGKARAYHRIADEDGGEPSLSYVRGTQVVVLMKPPAAGRDDEVDRVIVRGQVDGVQLSPRREGSATPARDTTPRPPAPSGGGGRP
jgi:hypothetical protein